MKLPFKQEEFLGNIRSGKRRENNLPCNIDHFSVHHDSYTSEYSIELFKSVYSDKTDTLVIIPVTNMIISQEIYKKDIKCRGEKGKKAIRIDGKGVRTEVNCDPEKCEFALNGKVKCKKAGRLYFKLVGIEDKGVWCYTTGSKRMEHIQKYLEFMTEKGIDITKNEFLLTLNETTGTSGKVYAPDIKIINNEEKTNEKQPVKNAEQKKNVENTNKQSEKQNLENSKHANVKNLYKYVEGKMVEYKSQNLPRLVFMDREGKENVFFMTKNSKRDILNLGKGSEIEILKVSANKANDRFLMDYNVITKIDKNKKAV